MTFDIIPGNALGCRTNAHRHGWDGTICDDASEWACGIEADFRTKYCSTGTPRCFHLHLFDDEGPSLVIPDSGVGWLLGQDPHSFDDQVLLIWAPHAEEPNGMLEGRPVGSVMAGAYRIEKVERIEQRNHIEWRIRPYEDGWTYMGSLETQAPRFIHLGGPYIKQVDRKAIGPLFESAVEAGAEVNEDWTAEERDRLVHFASKIDEWLDLAEERIHALGPVTRQASQSVAPVRPTPVRTAPAVVEASELEPMLATRLIPLPAKPPSVEAPEHYPLIEEAKCKAIEATYGAEVLHNLRVADLTKPLLLLRGPVGVGKSRLALDFIEDANRERTVVIPVSANWKSSQGLLGQWNPTTGVFEPTQFTNFMRAAELAWRSGDFATRLVVFENFDLSPPENWLAEILLRCQYPAHCTGDRTIHLGGRSVRGWSASADSRLLISPAVRFVGVMDEPARPGTMSQRLLDNVASVKINVSAAAAIKLVTPGLSPGQTEALVALDTLVRPLRAGITFTTTGAIRNCLKQLDALELDAWQAIDTVLEQEVIPKLELLTHSTVDKDAAHGAILWAEGPGRKLPRSAARLTAWADQIGQTHIFKGS